MGFCWAPVAAQILDVTVALPNICAAPEAPGTQVCRIVRYTDRKAHADTQSHSNAHAGKQGSERISATRARRDIHRHAWALLVLMSLHLLTLHLVFVEASSLL